MICSYLHHIDITAVYREIYQTHCAHERFSNIHPAIYEQAAILFELRAESVMEGFYSEKSTWMNLDPAYIAAEVSDYIEADIEALFERCNKTLPIYTELSDAEWFDQLQVLAALAFGVGDADYFELQALMLCLYDCACWLHERRDIDALMEVLARVEETASQIAHIELLNDIPTIQARSAAEKRHKDTNNQRALALADWNENGAKYSTKTAFAERNHRKYSVKQITLMRWITQHQKAQSKRGTLLAR